MDAPNFSTENVMHPSLPSTRSPSPHSFPTPSQLLSDIAKAAPHRPPPQNQRGQLGLGQGNGQGTGGRKQRNRLASLGFQPTDPESISSHDRKRYYLECIESYSLYLQDRVRAAGFRPVPIQRVIPPSPSSPHSPASPANSSVDRLMGGGAGGGPVRTDRGAAHRALCSDAGKGLSIESIRTLLVHMESTARKLNEQTLVEEQQFAKLRAQYEALHANDHPHSNPLLITNTFNNDFNNIPLPNDADSPYQGSIGSISGGSGSISGGSGSELSENSASAGSSPNGGGEMSS